MGGGERSKEKRADTYRERRARETRGPAGEDTFPQKVPENTIRHNTDHYFSAVGVVGLWLLWLSVDGRQR